MEDLLPLYLVSLAAVVACAVGCSRNPDLSASGAARSDGRTPASSAPVAVPFPPVSETGAGLEAGRFVTRLSDWEGASSAEADRIEAELRDSLTDENAAMIVRALPARFHVSHLGLLALERWATHDRVSAARWLEAQSSPTLWQAVAVARDWTTRDAAGVFSAHHSTLPPGAWRDLLTDAMIRDSLAQQEPALAFALGKTVGDAPARLRALEASVLQWAEWDAHAALAQVNALPDVATQEKLIPGLAIGHAAYAPRAAAEWLLASLEPGEGLAIGLTGVMQRWIRRDAASARDAAAWAATLPEGRAREAVFAALREEELAAASGG